MNSITLKSFLKIVACKYSPLVSGRNLHVAIIGGGPAGGSAAKTLAKVAKSINTGDYEYAIAFQERIKIPDGKMVYYENLVEMYVGDDVSPNFYGWSAYHVDEDYVRDFVIKKAGQSLCTFYHALVKVYLQNPEKADETEVPVIFGPPSKPNEWRNFIISHRDLSFQVNKRRVKNNK
ncbi:hypothetical protein K1719_043196 [Acacia pycnantha]|nr:hypothetical protein K1719_043196 [Acacia pycnantha]